GFTSAAALVIGASQLRHLVGVDLGGAEAVHEIVAAIVVRADRIDPLTLGVGLGGIVLLLLLRRFRRTFPGPLLVVGLATAAAWLLGLEARGLRVVGEVPGGLPLPTLPVLDLGAMAALTPVALT